MRLVPEETLAAREAAFDAVRSRLPGHHDLTFLEDRVAGRSLKFYLLLTEMPELLAPEQASPEEIFWTRYYWFVRYARLQQAVYGYDAGLEQQAFQILDYPQPDCDPDWNWLESVHSHAAQSAEAQLAALDVSRTA
jgi:hypothetical protein